jgi:anti-sigma factor RsiW
VTIPDETLMAYADGELEPAQRAEVAAALAADPQLARRVEQHQGLRKKLSAAFDPVLLETVPDSLIAAARSAPVASSGSGESQQGALPREATVTDLRRVRAARAAEAKEAAASARRGQVPRRPWTWVEWTAMAASVAAGAVIAHLALKSPDANRIGTDRGQLVAQADLADALSNQLASNQPVNAPVQIGVSFRSRAGDSCRTFTVKERDPIGGLACRQGNTWRVQVLANVQAGAAADGGYKPAGGSMPAAVIAAVEQQIDGEPLDAAAESAARARGWK